MSEYPVATEGGAGSRLGSGTKVGTLIGSGAGFGTEVRSGTGVSTGTRGSTGTGAGTGVGTGANETGGTLIETGSEVEFRAHKGSGPVSGSIYGTGLSTVRPIGAEGLVALLEGGLDSVLLIDSRPFIEYNSSHILEAVNVNCSKLMKRRLQQDKIQINELLQHSTKKKLELMEGQEVVVYDQSSLDPMTLPSEAFLTVLLAKLERSFPSVHLLSGGFSEFSELFPGLCEGKALLTSSCLVPSCLSQPCLPLNTSGPTRILPHLYLGCQRDVLNKELMQQNDIVFVLNASNTCPKPDYIPESHFLRVPVNDSFCEKILPWLDRSVEFIEKAKASNACVLVHCLAGISRSATIAIAYIMKRMDMSLDEAYRFVKEKRPTISPNFNFLGQLLDFEKKIKSPGGAEIRGVKTSALLHPPLEQTGQGSRGDTSNPTPGAQDTSMALLEPLTLPCVLAPWPPEERLLAQALQGLQLDQGGTEDSLRLKRSFSLDIKSYGEPGGCSSGPLRSYPHPAPQPYIRDQENDVAPLCFKEPANAPGPLHQPPAPATPLHQATGFLFGLSRSQQHLSKPASNLGSALKGWHSDVLLAPVTVSSGGWYLSESHRFYSTSAILGGGPNILGGGGFAAYSMSQGFEEVRRRGRQRSGDHGDSRRSWHEESTFEKQLKRRSCQMEFGDRRRGPESPSREEVGRKVGSQSSFSGSMEVIEVS
ncbi:hypothetical protein DPEC_G00318290 [Dallia pectoralis]|uniref:Uncharacterized protein n=1 Tax=Dallia pectoralis TaxID=75939 RepID=A0ACC2F993_DALPE|nr:hypothetical protein DPEC_G00318290 [Dallia pectoralis]